MKYFLLTLYALVTCPLVIGVLILGLFLNFISRLFYWLSGLFVDILELLMKPIEPDMDA